MSRKGFILVSIAFHDVQVGDVLEDGRLVTHLIASPGSYDYVRAIRLHKGRDIKRDSYARDPRLVIRQEVSA